MVAIRDNAISPAGAHFSRAMKRFPGAHRDALGSAASHLHGQLTSAAQEAGLPVEPIVLRHGQDGPVVGIEHSSLGDQVADHEFGTAECTLPDGRAVTPGDPPNPVLRQAAHEAGGSMSALYTEKLRAGMGL